MFAAPRASSSCLASILVAALRGERARGEHVVGVADERTPTAGSSSIVAGRRRPGGQAWAGPRGCHRPAATPCVSRSNTRDGGGREQHGRAGAPGPGGRRHCRRSTQHQHVDARAARVGQCTCVKMPHEGRSSPEEAVASTVDAGQLAELADDHDQQRCRPCSRPGPAGRTGRPATPARATQARRRRRDRPASERGSAAYRPGRRPRPAPTAAAVISAVVDSGPTDSCREEPSTA